MDKGKLGFACAAVAVLLTGLLPALAANTTPAKVLAVIDGDTISVDRGKGKERVILYGIDCPEPDQPSGAEAKKYTDDRCWKKVVGLEDHGTDSRGRVIAVIFLSDGTNLNEDLVQHGLAWWSDKYAPKDAALKKLHESAKAAHVGLWAAPNAVPPWIWRNGKKDVQAKIVGGK